MEYVGRYTSGGGDHDPRQLTWVKYQCQDCNHIESYNKTVQIRTGTFQQENFGHSLKCPNCGSYGQSDEAREKRLREQLEELTAEKSIIEVSIERIINELAEMGVEDEVEEERKNSLLWSS